MATRRRNSAFAVLETIHDPFCDNLDGKPVGSTCSQGQLANPTPGRLRTRSYSLSSLHQTFATKPLAIPCIQAKITELASAARFFRLGELLGALEWLFDEFCIRSIAPDPTRLPSLEALKNDVVESLHKSLLNRLELNNLFEMMAGEVASLNPKAAELLPWFKGTYNFLSLALYDRLRMSVASTVNYEGYVYYSKVIFGTPRPCSCNFCPDSMSRGVLLPHFVRSRYLVPENALSWPANVVLSAGLTSWYAGVRELGDLIAYSEIQIRDLASPADASEDHSCSICFTGEDIVQTHGCKHLFCAACLLSWANEIPDPDEDRVACPICRQSIWPPKGPYTCFALSKNRRKRLYAIADWVDMCPIHPCYGLDWGWEEQEVDIFVEVLENETGKNNSNMHNGQTFV